MGLWCSQRKVQLPYHGEGMTNHEGFTHIKSGSLGVILHYTQQTPRQRATRQPYKKNPTAQEGSREDKEAAADSCQPAAMVLIFALVPGFVYEPVLVFFIESA